MSTKFLTATASAIVMMAAVGAHANDMHNMGNNAAIQKGQSASVKEYGYNKQGDHYNTNNVRQDRRDMSWDERHTYPGERLAFGTRSNALIQKGGSAITDTTVNAQADVRPYGTYWR